MEIKCSVSQGYCFSILKCNTQKNYLTTFENIVHGMCVIILSDCKFKICHEEIFVNSLSK